MKSIEPLLLDPFLHVCSFLAPPLLSESRKHVILLITLLTVQAVDAIQKILNSELPISTQKHFHLALDCKRPKSTSHTLWLFWLLMSDFKATAMHCSEIGNFHFGSHFSYTHRIYFKSYFSVFLHFCTIEIHLGN